VCANHLAGYGIGRYAGSHVSTKLKVTGVDLFSAGDFTGGTNTEEIVLADPAGGVYKKLVIRDDKLVGGVLYGDTADGAWYFKLVRDGRSIAEIRDRLMFGEANLGDTGHQGQSRALAMADDAEVCGCNGVCKGTIVKGIKEQGLFTLDDVRKHTKASSSCGSCTGLVEQLLMATAGGDYSAPAKLKPLCGCTDRNHQQVRDAIREEHLLSIPATMRFLEWRTPNGCATCRPALNYYLLSTWPKEATDDPQSRFINERAHANIQKDGTYSVIPRMWGGETNSSELRRIADVVDKYQIRTVKVTGGQRIDLLGVKKADLPAVWADLGMPSGHAYAKALRTVKTCVGSEWCRFGTQDSTTMGQDLERALWRMYAPHKVKLAVSGCPRNCAESGIKDVGVIGVESGWEIYVAGNGGIKTEVAQFLVKVKTRDEVLEYSGAFLQLYREEGWYLERTVHYIARVGLDHVKRKVLDDADNRRVLWERLQFTLDGEPDPWHDMAKARIDTRQFEALALA
jgi:nitrite reductase (NADH) large subunit